MEFIPLHKNRVYCSDECSAVAIANNSKKKHRRTQTRLNATKPTRECAVCKTEFRSNRDIKILCGDRKCKREYEKMKYKGKIGLPEARSDKSIDPYFLTRGNISSHSTCSVFAEQ